MHVELPPSEDMPAVDLALLERPPNFELSTPMLVMPFHVFKSNGRIVKSVKAWREEAIMNGSLVRFAWVDGGTGKVDENGELSGTLHVADGMTAIFVSHVWWDREFVDESNDPNDPYDRGAPDWQWDLDVNPLNPRGEDDWGNDWPDADPPTKNLKHRVICWGVERLIKQKQLDPTSVVLWVDWQSIYQDDAQEKTRGVLSLIKYATLCHYMIVPIEDHELKAMQLLGMRTPEWIPIYSTRAWCRLENFMFSLWAEMQGREVQLFAILRDCSLVEFQKDVEYDNSGRHLPSHGVLTNPNDAPLVKALEDTMIEAYGKPLVIRKCQEETVVGGEGGDVKERMGRNEFVNLSWKLMRAAHVPVLAKAVEENNIRVLKLLNNQLGAGNGPKLIAAMLRSNTTLISLVIDNNGIDKDGAAHIAEGLKSNVTLTRLSLSNNKIGFEGAKHLAKALEQNTALTTLEIANIGPTPSITRPLFFSTKAHVAFEYGGVDGFNPLRA